MHFFHIQLLLLLNEPFLVFQLFSQSFGLVVEHNGCSTLILSRIGSLLILRASPYSWSEIRHPGIRVTQIIREGGALLKASLESFLL